MTVSGVKVTPELAWLLQLWSFQNRRASLAPGATSITGIHSKRLIALLGSFFFFKLKMKVTKVLKEKLTTKVTGVRM